MTVLAGRNVLITGAASGIGRLMALKFARERCSLILVDIDRKLLEETERELLGMRARVESHVCDISDRRSVERMAQTIRRQSDPVDILVNNAGIVTGKSFLDLSFDELKRTMDVNFLGMALLTGIFLPGMVERNSGHIVNIASSAGLIGIPRMSDYCASKFAAVGFSESLRLELLKFGHTGVRVSCVCPYLIDTGMFRGFRPFVFNSPLEPGRVADTIIAAIKKNRPMVMMPFSVRLIKYAKMLPVRLHDRLVLAMGAGRAMDSFIGKR
ncbi:MAG TPA: SDR family oxidoreductase [Spirochaetota bacterium]|nr:SDR family oxidoreductase [Spirochaetota bacterium]HPV98070.1 SDR family oxidoreductase [Spirochaetota bacterium]